jgi:cytochrome c2
MPQLNMTDHEAGVIADFLTLTLQALEVSPGSANVKEYTPQMAALGKQLYEVKYQCQSCHTIGSSGGYVGPSLSNAGNWLTPEWIEAWLRDPQKLAPGAMEPRLPLQNDEVKALTAYLLTLRQSPGGKTSAAGGAL